MSLLCDVGNSFLHFYDGERFWRASFEELDNYAKKAVYYINVNQNLKEKLHHFQRWINLEPYIELRSSYEGLGADRKALCSLIEEGVVVDAGSAITVDVMEDGVHKGGFIYPGLRVMRLAYASISPLLNHPIEPIESFPQNTKEAIGYGALKPLVEHIKRLHPSIYITGGDGKMLASMIAGAIYDETLLFQAMQKIKDRIC